MKVNIIPKKLDGIIKAPADKSEIIRYIIISALKEQECSIRNINLCDDVLACMDCVENMKGIMNAGESATVLRLLLPAVVKKFGKADFICTGKLLERPMKPYEDIFDVWEVKGNRLHVEGKLGKGPYKLPGNISSQFFSGLLIAGCELIGEPESSRYYKLTKEILSRHNYINIICDEDKTLKAFWEIGKLEIGDASEEPDLVPCWALQAALSPGRTIIDKASRLRFKESDRLKSISAVLNKLGAKVTENENGLEIFGVERLSGGCQIDPFSDHRIAMMAAVAAQWCERPVTILNAECVSKSYPAFYDDYERLGGILNVV